MRRVCLFALLLAPLATVARAQIEPPIISLEHGSWSERPTEAEFEAAKPHGVVSRGYVILACRATAEGRLADCKPELEDPKGQGFGTAALSLVPRFRLDPRAAGFVHGAAAKVSVQFNWRGDGGPCYPPYCSFIPPPPPAPAGPR
jgi:hypothetical protein